MGDRSHGEEGKNLEDIPYKSERQEISLSFYRCTELGKDPGEVDTDSTKQQGPSTSWFQSWLGIPGPLTDGGGRCIHRTWVVYISQTGLSNLPSVWSNIENTGKGRE